MSVKYNCVIIMSLILMIMLVGWSLERHNDVGYVLEQHNNVM